MIPVLSRWTHSNSLTQVVVLTKADLPHVAADLDERIAALHAAVPHARTLCISSRSGLNVRLLLRRVRALLTAIDGQRERGGAS